ncbi:hypothetical protein [Burkholderia pyrrocinia]
MGFLNKIKSHHSLLDSVRLKHNQSSISAKTEGKIDKKIATHINDVKNGNGDIRPIKDALNHLESLNSGTPAAYKMIGALKAAIKTVRDIDMEKAATRSQPTPVVRVTTTGGNKDALASQHNTARFDSVSRLPYTAKPDQSGEGVPKGAMASNARAEDHKNAGVSTRDNSDIQRDISNKFNQDKKNISGGNVRDKLRLDNIEKQNQKNKEIRNKFSIVFQANKGCKLINDDARRLFGSTSSPTNNRRPTGGDVIREYEREFGDTIFSRGNSSLKSDIKLWCDNAIPNIKIAADAFYTPCDAKRETWRGAGITRDGLTQIIDGRGCTFRAAQFMSTSPKKIVANDFCKASGSEVPVLFKIEGTSCNRVAVGNGLSFGGHGAGGEAEQLYSPRACFEVMSVRKSAENRGPYIVKLKEVSEDKKAPPLPY